LKTAALTGTGKFEVLEIPTPEIVNGDDVLLKVSSVGICGSDLHYYRQGRVGDQVIKFPFTVGHECSAMVEIIGANVKKVKPGDIIAVEPALSCHQCQQCLSGREHTCLNQKFLGAPGQQDGCLAEYIVMPESNCFVVPENVNEEQAALIEPMSIGYYAVSLAYRQAGLVKNPKEIKSAAILGVGPIGLGVQLSLLAAGINNIYVTDKLNYRLDAAKKAGAVEIGNVDEEDIISKFSKENPDLFDLVFECCGEQDAMDQAIELLKPGGTLLIVGIPEVDRISFDVSKIRRKEITIQNVRRQNNSMQPCIDLCSSGKWSPEFMITHRFPLEKTNEAFDTVSNYKDSVIKALIKF
jgi:L-iditol 2-dehydrogenase